MGWFALASFVLSVIAPWSSRADELYLLSIGVRARVGGERVLGERQPEAFREYDAVASIRLPLFRCRYLRLLHHRRGFPHGRVDPSVLTPDLLQAGCKAVPLALLREALLSRTPRADMCSRETAPAGAAFELPLQPQGLDAHVERRMAHEQAPEPRGRPATDTKGRHLGR
jgi:hypothetical protein